MLRSSLSANLISFGKVSVSVFRVRKIVSNFKWQFNYSKYNLSLSGEFFCLNLSEDPKGSVNISHQRFESSHLPFLP